MALQIRREVDPVHAVLLAACAILFVSPQSVFDLSFQLSFLAIWGLVVLAPLFSAAVCQNRRISRIPKALVLLVAASAAAIVATMVPVAYYFHRISLAGLLANVVVVPLMGYGAVVTGFLALPLVHVAPAAAGFLLEAAAFLVRVCDQVILYLARVPAITGYVPQKFDLLLALLALGAFTFVRPRRAALLSSLPLALLLLIRAVPAGSSGDGALKAIFLSVGQGDATLVGLPDGRWLLVDGGGRGGDTGSRVGERLLLPALRSLGVRRIDYLALSHEHPDHLQGVLFLARSFEVGEFWESGVPSDLPEYRQLKWVLSARGIPVRQVNASTAPIHLGGVRVEALWPPGPRRSGSGDANDSSMVLRVSYGKSALLLTGDIGAGEERELVAQRAPLACSVLKVPHHGSKYSSTAPFLAAASPEVAVISAGYRNPFHLPAPSTVQRVQRLGIRLYRTDLDGSVQALLRGDGSLSLATPWGAF